MNAPLAIYKTKEKEKLCGERREKVRKGGGFLSEIPSMVGVWIFSGTTQFKIISLLFGSHLQGCNELFKAEDFTPYDPTQDVIFPPELMVRQPVGH